MIEGLYDIFRHWHITGTVWIYSDTHFNDTELAAGVSARPSAEDHLKLINSKVGKKDTLIHLGDVGNIEMVKKIKGYKILIAGNHDAGLSNYERQQYLEIFDKEKYTKEAALEAMKEKYPNCRYTIEEGYSFKAPFIFWKVLADNMLFDEVYGGPLMIAEKLILSHEPVDIPWAFNIHGHVHSGGPMSDERHLNVCGEARGVYEPINFNQFMKSGFLSKIQTIHRETINKATKRAQKRGKKKCQE